MSDKPKFFCDTHIAKAAVIQLRNQGMDIVRCEEVGLAEVDDPTLLAYAAENERVMLSCDHGFRNWGFLRIAEGKDHAGIIQFDQERHCQQIGRLIKIVQLFYELSDSQEDRRNQLYEGKDFEE